MRYSLLILVLLASTAWGTIRTIGSGDLPYTSQAAGDTIRFTGTKVTSNTGGITVVHSGIFIDGLGDTLEFDDNSGGGVVGIQVNSYNLIIRDLDIIQSGTGDGCDNINLTHGGYGTNIINCTLKVSGTNNCNNIDSYGTGSYIYNIYIDSCHFWNYSTGYSSRMNYGGAAIRLESRNPGIPGGAYSVRIYRSVVHVAPHCSFTILGNDTTGSGNNTLLRNTEIAYCSTYTDHQNTMYPTWDGTTGHSSANAYGLMIRNADGSLRIHDNYIGAGTAAGGSRGLMLEGIDGSASDSAKVYNNTVNINCGPDVNYSPARGNYVHSWAVRIRDIDNQLSKYLEFYNNNVTITIDTFSQVGDAYGYWATGLNFSQTIANDGHMTVHNNHIVVTAINTRAETQGHALMFSANPQDSTIHFYDNYFKATTKIMLIQQAAGIDFVGDTLGLDVPDTANVECFYLGWPAQVYNCGDNIIRNAVYLQDAIDTNIVLANAGTLDLTLQELGRVYVLGASKNNLLVANADVWIINKYGETVFTGNTGDSGIASGYVSYWFESRTETDSTAFNDFTFWAKKADDSANILTNIGYNFHSDTVTLANTEGSIPLSGATSPTRVGGGLINGVKIR